MNKVLNSREYKRIITRMAAEILEKNGSCKDVAVIGIQDNGVYLADRLVKEIKKQEKIDLPLGTINISLYRDDYGKRIAKTIAPSQIDFDINGKTIILVDDVLYTGRTVRSGIEAIFDLGRPDGIQLAVLIDREQKELPFCADFVGRCIPVSKKETIEVMWKEKQEEDAVYIKKIGKNQL
ncbi:MAG: bifunctional pyr operon transcriptional regulator/uracil phosphoribosyltransferase PyrR [Armatimonadetes bacterium]|nr:bifunctional pyr operon transcriptional regulator/uracil phosphoribosyltransferase PyrR [Candidatus Hippobium faecium]